MTKNKRMISLLGLDKSIAGMFSSYCHLLKPQLTDNWVVNRIDGQSEINIVSADYNGVISNKSKVKIILGESTELISENEAASTKVFNIPYPIKSSNILEVLNNVSKVKGLQKKGLFGRKDVFSLKNVFSKFMHKAKKKDNVVKINPNKNKSNLVANKLINICSPNAGKALKVVFLGRPGSGKTTAITSISEGKTLTSEVSATDSVGMLKDQTTIGIDYGECLFNNGTKLRLYGTPGQRRYDYVQTQTVARADVYVTLVDLSSVAPFAEFMYYKDIIESSGNDNALRVVAFTHYDEKEHNMNQLSKEIRHKCHGEILSVKIDTRKKDEVRFMLEKAAEMKLGSVPSAQYYAENSLFLRNINA